MKSLTALTVIAIILNITTGIFAFMWYHEVNQRVEHVEAALDEIVVSNYSYDMIIDTIYEKEGEWTLVYQDYSAGDGGAGPYIGNILNKHVAKNITESYLLKKSYDHYYETGKYLRLVFKDIQYARSHKTATHLFQSEYACL